MGLIDVLLVVSYLAFMVIWGAVQARKVKAGGEFSGAARGQSTFMVFASMAASFIGGGFSFGLASRAYAGGIGHVLALWGFSAGTVLVGLFVAPRLQRFKGCATVGSLMGRAYGPAARVAVGLLAAFFCCAVVGAQLRALGLLLRAWLGLDFRIGALIGAAALVALCAAGGSRAVVSIAPAQCLLLFTGFSLMLAFSAVRAGGIANLAAAVPESRYDIFSTLTPSAALGTFLMFMSGETLAPPYVKNLLTGRDGGSARRGAVAAGLFSMLLFSMCGAIGLCALVFLPKINPELALPALMGSVLPAGLKGLAAAGVVAGLTAAGSAFLNAAAANLTEDVLGEGPERGLVAARTSTVAFGLIAAAVAVFSAGVLEALGLAYGVWAPAVVAPLVAAAYGRRAGPGAFWASAVSGVAAMLVWQTAYGNPFNIPSVVSGIMVSAGVLALFPRSKAIATTPLSQSGKRWIEKAKKPS
jgi:SSS family solute:Na+ symporter